MVEFLLTINIDLELLTTDSRTSLHIAAQEGHSNVIKTLLFHGATLHTYTTYGHTPVHLAVINEKFSAVKMLVKDGYFYVKDKNTIDTSGWDPLHHACRIGRANITETLIGGGADVNQMNNDNDKPLDIAINFGHLNLAKFFIDKSII